MRAFFGLNRKGKEEKQAQRASTVEKPEANGKPVEPPKKKMPVFFIDEAHKLYVHDSLLQELNNPDSCLAQL